MNVSPLAEVVLAKCGNSIYYSSPFYNERLWTEHSYYFPFSYHSIPTQIHMCAHAHTYTHAHAHTLAPTPMQVVHTEQPKQFQLLAALLLLGISLPTCFLFRETK